jgi:hypothetical protein
MLFSSYFFSTLLSKHLASTTNRTLGGDHECGRYEKVWGAVNSEFGIPISKGGPAPHKAKQG